MPHWRGNEVGVQYHKRMGYHYPSLNPQKALIWRITHRDNVPWILDKGLHCATSQIRDPHFVAIGNKDLIDRRSQHQVTAAPGGTLSDYVPFYFTPFSPMMFNIKTGRSGVQQRSNEEIVILVSSLPELAKQKVPFLYTQVHALLKYARFSNDLSKLPSLDWAILQARNFSRDDEDPGKMDRYMAEALAYRHVPIQALQGIVCYTDAVKTQIAAQVNARKLGVQVFARTEWYF